MVSCIALARPSTLIVYRRVLALLVCVEAVDRWAVTSLLYSNTSVGDRGILDSAYLDELEWTPILLLAGAACAMALIAPGVRWPQLALMTLYLALSLRAPSFFWILDRYVHTLLIVSALLPSASHTHRCVSSGVVALARLQVCWIYFDAGIVKLRSGAWWRADHERLSALDVYLRHTSGAHAARWMLAPLGEEAALYLLSTLTVLVEIGAPAALLLACLCGARTRRLLVSGALVLLAGLHLTIALTMSGTTLLSAFAALALLLWLDVALLPTGGPVERTSATTPPATRLPPKPPPQLVDRWPTLLFGLLLTCCMLYETGRLTPRSSHADAPVQPACEATDVTSPPTASPSQLGVAERTALELSSAMASALQVLLGNRWNVFGPAEPTVTWEIAPARLADGSLAELWRAGGVISWAVPSSAGETLWHGRYRMLPFLSAAAASEAEAGTRFWDAICQEWDRRQPTAQLAERRAHRFKFFLLRAPLLRGGQFGPVSKTLVRTHTCAAARET